jgi:branched-chain amino acid transport system permease protein
MELIMQTISGGLIIGLTYALAASGLTLVFGIGRIVNFAHGEFIMIGAYGVVIALSLGLRYPLACVFGVVLVMVVGFVVERGLIARGLYEADEHSAIIVTFALGLLLTNGALIIFGPESFRVDSPLLGERISLGVLSTDGQRGLTALISIAVLIGLSVWLKRSRFGLQMVAASQNAAGSLYTGINVKRIRTIAFVIGASMAGLVGVLIAPTMTVFPSMGQNNVVIAFTVVILGGLGSVSGAAIGGLVVGLVQSLVSTYAEAQWATAAGWILVIIILLVRPQGLLGKKPVRS